MPQQELTTTERRRHRAAAHQLDPVVMIGAEGLSTAVQNEVDAALSARGLIKIRVLNDDRAARERMLAQLADALDAAPVQHIGKLLVLWRQPLERERPVDDDRLPGPHDAKVIRYSKRGGQRPQVRRVQVLGNQRLTAGGKIKKARRTQKSTKKGRGS